MNCFLDEIVVEHTDIEKLLDRLLKFRHPPTERFSAILTQLKGVLNAHFLKEEEALFPLTEERLSPQALQRLSAEMNRRQSEARRFSTGN